MQENLPVEDVSEAEEMLLSFQAALNEGSAPTTQLSSLGRWRKTLFKFRFPVILEIFIQETQEALKWRVL